MSVNNTSGIPDSKKHTRFGKNYFDIDFTANENLTNAQYAYKNNKNQITYTPIGTLNIGHKKFTVTWKELEKIQETISDAKYSLDMAYKLGMLK